MYNEILKNKLNSTFYILFYIFTYYFIKCAKRQLNNNN